MALSVRTRASTAEVWLVSSAAAQEEVRDGNDHTENIFADVTNGQWRNKRSTMAEARHRQKSLLNASSGRSKVSVYHEADDLLQSPYINSWHYLS